MANTASPSRLTRTKSKRTKNVPGINYPPWGTRRRTRRRPPGRAIDDERRVPNGGQHTETGTLMNERASGGKKNGHDESSDGDANAPATGGDETLVPDRR